MRYYTGPNYLEMIGRRFGDAAVEHLRRMTNVRLERDLLAGTMLLEDKLVSSLT